MSDKVYIGKNVSSFESGGEYEPFSGVRMWYDDEHFYFAGDDSGRVMECECPWATQEIVNNILAQIKGYVYKPFEAKGAVLNPAAELGDAVTVGGVYSVIGSMTEHFDAMGATDIAAKGGKEIEHEYPYKSSQDRAMKRKVSLDQTYYGARISRREGLIIEKTDGETVSAKAVLNADELSFYDAGGGRVLYFDPGSGTYKFTGELNVNDNFIVDKLGNVTINGSLTMTGTSNWLQTRYSTNKNAPVPSGWTEAWNSAWDNTSTQVWTIYSYDGGTKWTVPMLAQGKDGVQGPSGPSGSDANVPAWVKAYTQSAEFDTLVTDEWVVSMNLFGSKIFGGDYFSSDGNTRFDLMDLHETEHNFGAGMVLYRNGVTPIFTVSSDLLFTQFRGYKDQLFLQVNQFGTSPMGKWDFSFADVVGLTPTFA